MCYKIAILVGSLRKDSYNRRIAENIMQIAAEKLEMHIVEIGDLPFYNQDLETETPPQEWQRFRETIHAADGVLFCTPEYNRSIPAVLKNAIDVGSRPKEKNVWSGKAGAVVSVSYGALAAFGANHILRQSLMAVNVPTMQHPEAYIGNAPKLFKEDGTLVEETKGFLEKFVAAYQNWVSKITD